jgi:hypothetical protein
MQTDCVKDDSPATKRINRFVEKFAWWIIGVVVMILGGLYNAAMDRISVTEEKVAFLYQDKVSRAELREVADGLRIQSDSNKKEILSQQEGLKQDILSRLDLILRVYPPKK